MKAVFIDLMEGGATKYGQQPAVERKLTLEGHKVRPVWFGAKRFLPSSFIFGTGPPVLSNIRHIFGFCLCRN